MGMVKELDFGRINALVLVAWLSNFENCIPL
jgi:hypothetical protein